MRRLALFARDLTVFLQHAVDVFFDRSQFRLFTNYFLSVGRYRAPDRLPDHAPVNTVLYGKSLYRLPGCVSQPDLFE